jgi:hypothetical protein
MNEFLEAFDGYVPLLAILIIVLVFRKPLYHLLAASRDRIASGSGFKLQSSFGSLEVEPLVADTEDAKDQARMRGESVRVFGDPDQLKLLFKVQADSWKKSTKALEVPGGCLVQVTTERQSADGDWTTAEALEFVPGVGLVPDQSGSGGYRLGDKQL